MSKQRQERIALAIFDWLNGDQAKGLRGQPPHTYNAGVLAQLWIGVDGYLDCVALAAVIDAALPNDWHPIEESRGTPIKGKVTQGGTVRLPASQIDFDGAYSFKSEHGGQTVTWTGIKPKRDGDEAVFDLPEQEIGKDSQS